MGCNCIRSSLSPNHPPSTSSISNKNNNDNDDHKARQLLRCISASQPIQHKAVA